MSAAQLLILDVNVCSLWNKYRTVEKQSEVEDELFDSGALFHSYNYQFWFIRSYSIQNLPFQLLSSSMKPLKQIFMIFINTKFPFTFVIATT